MYMKLSIAHWEFLDFTIHCDEILIILTCLAFMLLVLMVYFRFKGWPKFLGIQGTNANVLSAWMNRLKRLVTHAPAPAPAPNVSSPPKKPQVTEQNRPDVQGWGSTMTAIGETPQDTIETWMAIENATAKSNPRELNPIWRKQLEDLKQAKRNLELAKMEWENQLKDHDLELHASTASDTSIDSVKAPKIERWGNSSSVRTQCGSEASPRGRSPVRELGGRRERASRSWGFEGLAEFDESEWAGL